MPACSQASHATSSSIRCCGSSNSASTWLMPKNSALGVVALRKVGSRAPRPSRRRRRGCPAAGCASSVFALILVFVIASALGTFGLTGREAAQQREKRPRQRRATVCSGRTSLGSAMTARSPRSSRAQSAPGRRPPERCSARCIAPKDTPSIKDPARHSTDAVREYAAHVNRSLTIRLAIVGAPGLALPELMWCAAICGMLETKRARLFRRQYDRANCDRERNEGYGLQRQRR
jgi:hypothetical protein